MPSDTEGKAEYAFKFYKEELIKHFEEEEGVLELITGIDHTLDLMSADIYREHQELHELFNSIKDHPDLATRLDEIGKTLEIHVRKEERQLFPLIQETCSEEQMTAIERSLSSK